jgi:hypothetical protein
VRQERDRFVDRERAPRAIDRGHRSCQLAASAAGRLSGSATHVNGAVVIEVLPQTFADLIAERDL